MALRARHRGGESGLGPAVFERHLVEAGALVFGDLHVHGLRGRGELGRQLLQQLRDRVDGYDVVHLDPLDGALGHARVERRPGILHDRDPTLLLDAEESRRSVAEVAREQDADHPGPVVVGCAAEQRVDGRPVPIFLGPASQAHPAAFEEHVAVGGAT